MGPFAARFCRIDRIDNCFVLDTPLGATAHIEHSRAIKTMLPFICNAGMAGSTASPSAFAATTKTIVATATISATTAATSLDTYTCTYKSNDHAVHMLPHDDACTNGGLEKHGTAVQGRHGHCAS